MRMLHSFVVCACLALVGCRSAPPSPQARPPEFALSTDDPREAQGRVLDELLRLQNPDDGSWGDESSDKISATALAALALTRDRDPGRQERNEEPVKRGVRWMVGAMQSGSWNDSSGAPVDAVVHSIAATTMADAYGKSKSFLLRPFAQNAVDHAVKQSDTDDLRARIWRLVALCSAESAGLKVPGQTIENGATELERLADSASETLDETTRGAVEAAVVLCGSRAKETAGSALADGIAVLAANTPRLAVDAPTFELEFAFLRARALAAARARDPSAEGIATAANALWNHHVAMTKNDSAPSDRRARGDDVAWLARLALCLGESVSFEP